MTYGEYGMDYVTNPVVNKSQDQIFTDMDNITREIWVEEPFHYWSIEFCVPVPPVYYEGRFVKGVYFSQAVDTLNHFYPNLSKYFISVAGSLTSAYPWSNTADAFHCLYSYPERERWFREKFPEKAHKPLIPLEDSDFLSEYTASSVQVKEKDIDLLCVSRLHEVKNLAFLAEGLKTYRKKYPKRPIRMTLMNWREFDINQEGLMPHEIVELRKIESVLVHLNDYIDFVPQATWPEQLFPYYARSKATVLGSLVEGKNRSLHESMLNDTAILWFEDFNRYLRGDTPAFPDGAGMTSAFDIESWADTVHTMMDNYQDFQPGRKYREHYGRKNFLNTCIDHIPYFESALPGYQKGRHHRNEWWDRAIFDNHQLGLIDFLYSRKNSISYTGGVEGVGRVLTYYESRLRKYVE